MEDSSKEKESVFGSDGVFGGGGGGDHLPPRCNQPGFMPSVRKRCRGVLEWSAITSRRRRSFPGEISAIQTTHSRQWLTINENVDPGRSPLARRKTLLGSAAAALCPETLSCNHYPLLFRPHADDDTQTTRSRSGSSAKCSNVKDGYLFPLLFVN